MSKEVKILLVEDNACHSEIFTEILEYFGYVVEAVDRGWNILETIQTFQPDLVLLDLYFHGKPEGLETLRQIVAYFQHLPVVIISASGVRQIEYQALALGAKSFLYKPVSLRVIGKTVEKCVKQNLVSGLP